MDCIVIIRAMRGGDWGGPEVEAPIVLRREGLWGAGGCRYPSTETWEPARDGKLFEIEGGRMDASSSVIGVSSVLGAYADCDVPNEALVSADERWRSPGELKRGARSRDAEDIRSRGSVKVTGPGRGDDSA